MKTAAAYIRVSTDDQLEFSPDSQLKLIREYAQRNDFLLSNEFIFQDDAISGKDAKHRPAFNQMIALAKSDEHPFDVIIVWKFSRFARNQEESIVIKKLLRKANVEVRSISEPIDPDSAFGSLIERIIEWMDEYYLINLSTEVRRGMLEKVSRGQPVCHPPFGYDLIDGKYVPSDKAPIIREIFSSFNQGEGMITIARRLSNNGVRTNRGNKLDNRFVEYVLNNPVYIGKIRWSKDGRAASKRQYHDESVLIFDGEHEPLISSEQWELAQQKLTELKNKYKKSQRPSEKVSSMLKSLLFCSSCGKTLCRVTTIPVSFQCNGYSHGQCSVSHSITQKKAEDAVISILETAVATETFNIHPAPTNRNHSEDIEKQINAEKRKLERVKDAYASGIDTLEEYKQNKTLIINSIKKLESKLKTENKPVSNSDYAEKVRSVLDIIKSDCDVAVKNDALRSIIYKIIYNRPEKHFEVIFYE